MNFQNLNFLLLTIVFWNIYMISIYGLIDLLNFKVSLKKNYNFYIQTNKYLLICLLIISLIFSCNQRFYDTGLYHLPFINHLIKFSWV